jgi:hypothetical protein
MLRSSRRALLSVFLAACVLSAAGFALAKKSARAKVTEAMSDARAALDKRDFTSTIAALEHAVLAASEEAPLEIRKAIVVRKPITYQLGVYEASPGEIVSDGVVRIYLEVANFGTRVIDPETHAVELKLSGSFSLADGESIGKKELGVHAFKTRTPHHVTPVGLEFSLGKNVPRGAYLVDVRVVDAVTRKEATKKVRFVIGG